MLRHDCASAGELTEGFELVVRSQADLSQTIALRQSGLAMVRVDEFKQSLVNVVTHTILGLVL